MTIISLSKDAGKPLRAEALRRVFDLRASRGDSLGHIEDLMLYFTAPPARRPAKSAMEWVARAAAVRDVRPQICYVWVSPEGIAYGADGHRLHMATLPVGGNIAPGYYDPKTLKPVEGVGQKYPDVARVIKSVYGLPTCATSSALSQAILPEKAQALYGLEGNYVLQEYLNDATNYDDITVAVYGEGTNAKWYGHSEFGTYLVMGVRV